MTSDPELTLSSDGRLGDADTEYGGGRKSRWHFVPPVPPILAQVLLLPTVAGKASCRAHDVRGI